MQYLVIFSMLILQACAASIGEDQLNLNEISENQEATKEIQADETINQLKYKSGNLELVYCKSKDSQQGKVLVINEDRGAFRVGACRDLLVQEILAEGYDVVAMNRPGFGNSTPGPQDFSGPNTQLAITAVLNAIGKDIVGIWAGGSAASAAGFASKPVASIKWIMFADGIFDLEEFANGKGGLRNMLDEARKQSGDALFFEQRSLAWDSSGLPRTVAIYHAKNGLDIPGRQSSTFRDLIASAGDHVLIYDEIDGVSQPIAGQKLRLVLRRQFEKLKLSAKSN